MQGNIDFIGSLSGDISGGGGGGSDVTITPTLSSGTKIADYEIDGVAGILYAPPSTINRAQLPLLIIGDELRIDLSNYYTKAETQIELETYQRQIESIDTQVSISGTHRNQISLTFDIDDYQKKLTAGENITIDPDTNVISASGGSSVINYSTTEQDTGELWIDGTSHVYQKSFQATLSGSTGQIDLTGLNISKAWIKDGFYDIGATCLSLNEFMGGSAYCYTHINQGLNPPYIDCLNTISSNSTIYITIKYIKNS